MTHFKRLDPETRRRLEARGIDIERAFADFLEAIRAGDFPLRPDGLPMRPAGRSHAYRSFEAEARAA